MQTDPQKRSYVENVLLFTSRTRRGVEKLRTPPFRGRYEATRKENDRLLVLTLARQIEPDPGACERWMTTERIVELDNRTAMDLIEQEQAGLVVTFLVDILIGKRDK